MANGIRQILTDMESNLPFVIRLVGTNEEKGRQILADANLITAESLTEAAEKAVLYAQEVPQ